MVQIEQGSFMNKKIVNYASLAIITTALILSGYFYWLHQQRYPSTDDAYVQAHVINIAAQVDGKIVQVLVSNQQQVNKSQLLFVIDPKPFVIALQKAKANLQNTQ